MEPTAEDRDYASSIVEEVLLFINQKHPGLNCGDYITMCSILCYNISRWVTSSMADYGSDPVTIKETMNAIFSGAIQLEMLYEGNLD